MKKNNITSFKSKLSDYKKIDERNAAFHALSNEEKRREIAYDAINIVNSGKVNASFGNYWSNKLAEIEYDTAEEFQKRLIEDIPTCAVCQRGLVMLATIRLGDSIKTDDTCRDEGAEYNIQGFNMDDMLSMEEEYESSDYNHPYRSNTTEKLLNICYNVLQNGNFDTEDGTDYLTILNTNNNELSTI